MCPGIHIMNKWKRVLSTFCLLCQLLLSAKTGNGHCAETRWYKMKSMWSLPFWFRLTPVLETDTWMNVIQVSKWLQIWVCLHRNAFLPGVEVNEETRLGGPQVHAQAGYLQETFVSVVVHSHFHPSVGKTHMKLNGNIPRVLFRGDWTGLNKEAS